MHDHSHHSHQHHHLAASSRIGWAFGLNFIFTIIEFIGGWLTNSTAVMADAVHDLGDCLAIGLAWVLARVSGREADENYSYGYKRFSLMGALVNGLVLLVGSLWVLSEAVPRLMHPEMPMAEGMLGLAVFGMAVNGAAAYKLSGGSSLNERVLNWHLIEDVLGWAAVFIVALVMMFVELPILDPLLSIAFTLFILWNVAKNLKETVVLFLQAVPDIAIQREIRETLLNLPGIDDIHHMHLWSLDGEHHVLTLHAVLTSSATADCQRRLKSEIAAQLTPYELAHTTVEFEFHDEACRDLRTPAGTEPDAHDSDVHEHHDHDHHDHSHQH